MGRVSKQVNTTKQVEEVLECPICMEKADIVITYRCCKQPVCKECYDTMRVKQKKKDCPFCRHNPTRGGIEKRSKRRAYQQQSEEPEFLISRKPMVAAFLKELKSAAPGFKINDSGVRALRMAMEQYAIERMRVSQTLALSQGRYTVMHLAGL